MVFCLVVDLRGSARLPGRSPLLGSSGQLSALPFTPPPSGFSLKGPSLLLDPRLVDEGCSDEAYVEHQRGTKIHQECRICRFHVYGEEPGQAGVSRDGEGGH